MAQIYDCVPITFYECRFRQVFLHFFKGGFNHVCFIVNEMQGTMEFLVNNVHQLAIITGNESSFEYDFNFQVVEYNFRVHICLVLVIVSPPFMRATNIQFRTAFSAGLMPPLRQTASCRQCLFVFNSAYKIAHNSQFLFSFFGQGHYPVFLPTENTQSVFFLYHRRISAMLPHPIHL